MEKLLSGGRSQPESEWRDQDRSHGTLASPTDPSETLFLLERATGDRESTPVTSTGFYYYIGWVISAHDLSHFLNAGPQHPTFTI